MIFPFASGRRAIWSAAHTAAPDDMPTRTPSSRPISFPVAKGVVVGDGDDLIINGGIQGVRDEARSNTLDFVCAGVPFTENRRILRFDGQSLSHGGLVPSDTAQRR